jgi:hypothetical protein
VRKLREELQSRILERNKMLETMTEKHPHVQQVTAAIERLKEIVASEDKLVVTQMERIKNPIYSDMESRLSKAQTDLQVLQTNRASLEKEMEYYRQRAQQLPQMLQDHTRLAAELSKDNATLRDLLQRKSSAEITQALEVDSDEGMKFERPDPTAMPTAPYKPNRRVLVLLGFLLGAAGAAVLLFFVEYADRSIRGIADVKRHLGLPVLGTVPHFFKSDKGVKVRTGLSLRKAAACALTTTLVTLLVISFVFEREVSTLINQERQTPIAGKTHLSFPLALLDGNSVEFSAVTEKRHETNSFAPETRSQTPPAPDIEITDPGVLSSEEKP